jgi:hypothetical protein
VGGYARHVRAVLSEPEEREVHAVDELAARLRDHLQRREPVLRALHVYNAQSKAIQSEVGSLLEDHLAFRSEVVLTPQDGLVTQARPDFYFDLGAGRGVIAEVERGGTTANNHDLKDLWKTHIAMNAHHLFLVVPVELPNESGRVRERPFVKVVRRMGAFFGDPRREVDVLSVHVFGY